MQPNGMIQRQTRPPKKEAGHAIWACHGARVGPHGCLILHGIAKTVSAMPLGPKRKTSGVWGLAPKVGGENHPRWIGKKVR
jgi:hypothetical protein